MKIKKKDLLLVSLQFTLFFIYTINIDWHFGLFSWLKSLGFILAIVGILVILISLLQLNKNLSPFPTPKNSAVLIQNGLFKLVRHPIYSGIIILFFAYGIYRDSVFKIIITFLLLLLFYIKTDYEEKLLENKFPDYIFYKKKTGKFFPKF